MGDFEVSTGSFNKTLKLGTVHSCQQGSSSYTPGGLTYLYLFKCFLYSSWISQFQSSNTVGDFEVSTGSFNKTLKLGTVHSCQQGSSSYTPGGLTYHILRHCALSRFSGLHVE